jgi:hypothetical protein
MTKSDENDWLRKRLDMVIQLLLEMAPGGAASTTRKIERLLALGFSQSEVAQVVGKKVNYVSAVVAGMKKTTSARLSRKKKGQSNRQPALPAPAEASGEEQ